MTPVCNFGVTHYKGAVLFTGPYSETQRANLSVLASTDGNGVRFDRSLVLHSGEEASIIHTHAPPCNVHTVESISYMKGGRV